MPYTLRLPDGSYMRSLDVRHIVQSLYGAQCVSVIGFSNIGKSALLRLLAQPDVWIQELGEAGQEFLPVYVDCNRMLGMTDQGFYELVLRCLRESSDLLAQEADLREAYDRLVVPASEFQVPLSFNLALTSALQSIQQRVVLLLDEFDEPFGRIGSRVFLNLRALKDRYGANLTYVTATGRRLTDLRSENHCGEFCELFSQRAWYLAPLTRGDEERFVWHLLETSDVALTSADMDFIREWAGGHPTLLERVVRILEQSGGIRESQPEERRTVHREIARQLRTDEALNLECVKIWGECTDTEQEELLGLFLSDHSADSRLLTHLARRHILLPAEGKPQLFCRLLAEYIRRQVLSTRQEDSTLWVDVDSGDVYVNGEPVEMLTNLEYRLMMLLFQNAAKIVDKYQIVTEVWGEDYIDEVDDARIEKLVSRLRQKIEPDPVSPRFLKTIRGRGYRLTLE